MKLYRQNKALKIDCLAKTTLEKWEEGIPNEHLFFRDCLIFASALLITKKITK